jgi:Putative DNA-binding domain
MTFNLPLAQIDAAQLETLRADAVREGRQLDYKETLPGNSDHDKREFLSDVTSLANAAGGDLIFGVRERREAGKPTGEIEAIVGLSGLNVDVKRLRLEAMIRDGVAPRLPPVSFHEIRRDSDPPCLLLRVPRSWAGLHMVTYKNLSRFYARTSAGKYQLDVHEIRAGFVTAETAFERLRRFRLERVTRVLAFEAPAPIAAGPKLILHALPVNVLDEVWARVLTMEEDKVAFAIAPIAAIPATWRFNLEGFVVHTLSADLSRQCYTQLFRDGGIEVMSGRVIAKDDKRGGFYAWGMEEQIINRFATYQKFWQDLGVAPPLLIGLTLSGVKGWKVLRTPYGFNDQDAAVFDRDVVSPTEVMLSDLVHPADVVLHPLFDFVWNGGGWPGSPNYKDGRWFKPS